MNARWVMRWKGRWTVTAAFTLIELLVVIAIIAVLASLLLPALARAKEKGKAAASLSNVKQWVYAFYMYSDDNEDYFPYEGSPFDPIDAPMNAEAWYNVTTAYASQRPLKDLYASGVPPLPGARNIWTCPTIIKGPLALPTAARPFFMYGFNNRLDPNGPARWRRQDVLKPSDTVTFTENDEANFPSTSGLYTPARHSLRANLGFLDGHAQPVHTNDFRRTNAEDISPSLEWSKPRKIYWYPFPNAVP